MLRFVEDACGDATSATGCGADAGVVQLGPNLGDIVTPAKGSGCQVAMSSSHATVGLPPSLYWQEPEHCKPEERPGVTHKKT